MKVIFVYFNNNRTGSFWYDSDSWKYPKTKIITWGERTQTNKQKKHSKRTQNHDFSIGRESGNIPSSRLSVPVILGLFRQTSTRLCPHHPQKNCACWESIKFMSFTNFFLTFSFHFYSFMKLWFTLPPSLTSIITKTESFFCEKVEEKN